MRYFSSPRIIFGKDALLHLRKIDGKKAYIISDTTMRNLGFIDLVGKYLGEAGIEIAAYDGIEPEPSVEKILECVEAIRGFNPDWIVGLGGGSCMDAAKAVWVLYERPDLKIKDITPRIRLGLRKKARFVAIPTTSGTGSEVTQAAIIIDKEKQIKMEKISSEIIPDFAIIDPVFTMKMPRRLTAETGMDALCHALEASVSPSRTDFTEPLALRAIQLIFKNLPEAYATNSDEAKEKMHYAATLAGLAFTNSNLGLAHSMGHALGALFKIPHGASVGIFLPYVIQYNTPIAREGYAQVSRALRLEAYSDEEAVKKLIAALRDLMNQVDLPRSVKKLGLSQDDYLEKIEALVERAKISIITPFNPRVANDEDLGRLFLCAFDEMEVDF